MKMSWKEHWVCIIFLVVLNCGCFSEARHNPFEAVLVGSVYCNTCQHFSKASPSISGASIAVECGNSGKGPRFGKEVKTDENGGFKVNLPFSVIKHVKKTRGFCSVKLLSSSETFCAVAASSPATSTSSIHLKETKEGKHIFSVGSFTFKPDACNREPEGKNTGIPKSLVGQGNPQKGISSKQSKYLNPDDTSFPAPIQDTPPRGLSLPPVTQGGTSLPLPEIPPIPFLPGIPGFPPVPKKTENLNKSARDEKTAQPGNSTPLMGGLPPNPLLPAPSQLPVNPFLPPHSHIIRYRNRDCRIGTNRTQSENATVPVASGTAIQIALVRRSRCQWHGVSNHQVRRTLRRWYSEPACDLTDILAGGNIETLLRDSPSDA